jgi:glycosyltransferase involved in cell wall biosynthesis
MTHTVTIVIPAYNEAKRINRAFSALGSFRAPKGIKIEEVIFVNDGSTDKTLKLLKSFQSKYPQRVISYPKNMGKGFAVRKGMLASKSEFTLFTDADISTPLSEIEKFLPFMNAGLDVIVGTRKNGHSTVTVHQSWLRENMGKVFTYISRKMLGVNVTDFTCGFKMFKKEAKLAVFKRAQINKWGYDSEILFLAHKLGFNMIEKAVLWANQKNTKVNLIKDSFVSFKELVLVRFNYFSGKYDLNAVKDESKKDYNFS